MTGADIKPLKESLRCHLITQARLASNIRSNTNSTQVYDYANFSFWRQLSTQLAMWSKENRFVSGLIEQSSCRTLVQLIKVPTRHNSKWTSTTNLVDLEGDAVETSLAFIDACYDRSQNHGFVGSFVDGYDIFSATILYLFMTCRSTSTSNEQKLALSINIIHKCSVLMTDIAQRFSVFRAFQGTLLAISARLLSPGRPGATVRLFPSLYLTPLGATG